MKPVKTRPKFKCDYCRHMSGLKAMEKHEGICFLNPNRWCDFCKNKGEYTEVYGDLIEDGDSGLSQTLPCPYCSKFVAVSERSSE